MKTCHHDDKLDSLVGNIVRITFYDGKTEEGKLQVPFFNYGYMLITPGYDVRFKKSHVKRIEVIER